jgi:hypothetical protein
MSVSKKTMIYKGFKASIMEAERLTGDGLHGLPPGNPLDCYPSDAFLEYPEQWMKGPGVFVVPVRPNKGLWFDWTGNSSINTAVLPTVKGCNPITGMQTSGFHLERYEGKCPKHNVYFEGDRYCPECGYRWPEQNYVTAPNRLWWDGFRSDDGSVRQFFFTEEEMRDIATHMIGKENTVPAFGFAFYQPKELREEPREVRTFGNSLSITHTYLPPNHDAMWDLKKEYKGSNYSGGFYSDSYSILESPSSYNSTSEPHVYNCSVEPSVSHKGQKGLRSRSLSDKLNAMAEKGGGPGLLRSALKPVKEVSIGAGAKINQSISPDTYPLDSWRDKPSASMVIYFVFQEKLDQMLSKGVRDLEGKKDGMLDGMPVG